MSLSERITATLTPDLGPYTADAVARYLCAKFVVGDGEMDPGRLAPLAEFLRAGLVAYVGPQRAAELASAALAPPP